MGETWSPRNLAVRLRLDRFSVARSAYRASASARYFARGYRYGRHLPAPSPALPAEPSTVSELESYVNSYSEGPGINKWQHYLEIYDRHLSRFRGRPVHLVEIGVFGGGSMGMWRTYLGPDIHVYGVDIDPACRRHEEDGISIFIGDQADPKFWQEFLSQVPAIDIVIEDGGHHPEQQIATLEALLPHVSPGGVYITEDIHGPFQPFHSYVDGLSRLLSDIGDQVEENPATPLQQQIASIHSYPLMTVIEKPSFSRPRFESPRRGTEWPASSPFG